MSVEMQPEVRDTAPSLERVVELFRADRQASSCDNPTAVDRLLVASAYPFADKKVESIFSGFTDRGILFLAAKARDANEIFVATADLNDNSFTEWEPHDLIKLGPSWPIPLILVSPAEQEVLGLACVQEGWELIDGTSGKAWPLMPLSRLVTATM